MNCSRSKLSSSAAFPLDICPCRYSSSTIKLARRPFHRAMDLLEQINEILIEFDLDDSHDGTIVHPTLLESRATGAPG